MKSEKIIETAIYGVLSVAFMAAFFFGMMYPEYGFMEPITPQELQNRYDMQIYDTQGQEQAQKDLTNQQLQSETKSQGSNTVGQKDANKEQVAYLGNIDCTSEISRLQRMRKEDKVTYTSYFYECLKRKS